MFRKRENVRMRARNLIETNWLAALIARYFTDGVGVRAAALAYYLLFSIFPLLILFSSVIGLLDINLTAAAASLKSVLPSQVVSLVISYLDYVSVSYDRSLLMFSIVFSIYFPWRAVRGLMDDIRVAFGQDETTKPRFFILRELLCTIMIPFAVLLSLILLLLGRNVINFLLGLLPPDTVRISDFVLNIWTYARFVLAGAITAGALGILYELSLDYFLPFRQIFPGTFAAILAWIAVGWLFSFYAENFANYSVIYGTLGAVIVLMLWLYLTGLMFILGGEFNAVLIHVRENKKGLDLLAP